MEEWEEKIKNQKELQANIEKLVEIIMEHGQLSIMNQLNNIDASSQPHEHYNQFASYELHQPIDTQKAKRILSKINRTRIAETVFEGTKARIY